MVEVELKEWGNSTGVILPAEILKELGVKRGDRIVLEIQKKKIDGFGMCRGGRSFEREREHGDL